VNRVRTLFRHGTTSRRVLCCLAVSVGTTVLSALVLVALVVGGGMRAGTANIVAVCCGIVPSYVANRRWTWGRSGRGSLAREVVPFWALSIAGLLASTVTVALAGAWTATWSPAARSLVLPIVQAGTFGLLWIVQFVVLDRVVFRAPPVLPVVAAASDATPPGPIPPPTPTPTPSDPARQLAA
jgi:putative flippase GtrA